MPFRRTRPSDGEQALTAPFPRRRNHGPSIGACGPPRPGVAVVSAPCPSLSSSRLGSLLRLNPGRAAEEYAALLMAGNPHDAPSVKPDASARTQIRDLFASVWLAQGVYALAKLGVADHLSAGPKSCDDLASRVGANPSALYRILRACA